jgi:hypothetical protein
MTLQISQSRRSIAIAAFAAAAATLKGSVVQLVGGTYKSDVCLMPVRASGTHETLVCAHGAR